jgi:hypothetical protein
MSFFVMQGSKWQLPRHAGARPCQVSIKCERGKAGRQ